MKKEILTIKTFIDGVNDEIFYDKNNPIVITSYSYDPVRMGLDHLSGSFRYKAQLDDFWTGKQYVELRGEKYFVEQVPTSTKDNTDERYKYDVVFKSGRDALANVYMYDVVTDNLEPDKYQSNNTKVYFMGDIREFVKRLDYSFRYSDIPYRAVLDEGITSAVKQFIAEDMFAMDAMQEAFSVYNIPFYFEGTVVHFGYTNNAIATPFAYGRDRELLSITKTNANFKIVNRCSGFGSRDNIPHYYPNESYDRAAVEATGKKWITPTPYLMPPIYRESEGSERFYNATDGTYPSTTGGYIKFDNPYLGNNPKEQIVEFGDIKPSIVGITNGYGQRIDSFVEFAYDSNDNDEVDEDGNFIHPYFFGRLKVMNGEWGFNLFEHSIVDNRPMTISMTNGKCSACMFEIGVGEDSQKNLVQVDPSGRLLRDSEGDVICGRKEGDKLKPQPQQNDTQNNSVWIALKKDKDTFGVVMPNASNRYKPSPTDTFVILYIDLPMAYIKAAENRLKDAIIEYLLSNNSSKFNFSINFSRIYFAEHPEVLEMMNENARLLIEYNKKTYTLYVSSMSYRVQDDNPLPEISVELSDTITVRKGALEQAVTSIMGSQTGGWSGDIVAQGTKYFLRKDTNDRTTGNLATDKGFDVGRFSSLVSGGTFRIDGEGKSYLETDRLYVRMKAYFDNLEIKKISHIGGEQIITPASMKCSKVEDKGDFYRCYFVKKRDGQEIENEFRKGDQAICKETNLKTGKEQKNHYYWRLVLDAKDNYIDLSKSDCVKDSDEPQPGDDIVQLGNRDDKSRQNAIIQSSVSLDSPSIKFLQGVNSFDLTGKDIIAQGYDTTEKEAFMKIIGNFFVGNEDNSSYMKYSPKNGLEVKGKIIAKGEDGNDLDLEYLAKALNQDTVIKGGLVATSVISTGYKGQDGQFVVKGGLNGIYEESKTGGGISYWAGGKPIDRDDFKKPNTPPADAASAVVRMDGTGYLANGNIRWDKNGKIYADANSFFVGEETVGHLLKAFIITSSGDYITDIKAVATLRSTGDVVAFSNGSESSMELPVCSINQYGLCKPDGTTITSENGVLTAIGGGGSGNANVEWGSSSYTNYEKLYVNNDSPRDIALHGHTHTEYVLKDNTYWSTPSSDNYANLYIKGTSHNVALSRHTHSEYVEKSNTGWGTEYNNKTIDLSVKGTKKRVALNGYNPLLEEFVTINYNGTTFLRSGSNLGFKMSGGNGILGYDSTMPNDLGNLYLNYLEVKDETSSKVTVTYVKVTPQSDLLATGDVVSYSTGAEPKGLPVASYDQYGFVRIDDTTIKKDSNGRLYAVNTGGGGSASSDVSWGNTSNGYRTLTVNGTPENIALPSHNHNDIYLPLSGGTMTGNLVINNSSNSKLSLWDDSAYLMQKSIPGAGYGLYLYGANGVWTNSTVYSSKGFSVIGSDNNYVLLAGGGVKAVSSFGGGGSGTPVPGPRGQGVDYEWSGTSLRLGTIDSDGYTSWGSYVDLKGDKGDPGSGGGSSWNGGTITGNINIQRDSPYINGYNSLAIKVGGTSKLFVGSYQAQFTNLNGGVTINGNVVNTSDIRFKNRIEPVNGILDQIENMEVFRYTWKDKNDEKIHIGVSAQAIREVYPELVQSYTPFEDPLNGERLAVDYATLGTLAGIEGTKELYALIKSMQKQIDTLKQEINSLKGGNK